MSFFPLGDILSFEIMDSKKRSIWREYEYIYMAMNTWIVPGISWRELKNSWVDIVKSLADNKRTRETYSSTYYCNTELLK